MAEVASLSVLLGRFAERTGAAAASVIGRDDDGGVASWAHHDRGSASGEAFATSCEAIASEVMASRRARFEIERGRLPQGLLAVPIDGRDRATAALCAGFDDVLAGELAAVMWTARSYAGVFTLCLDEPVGFGRLVESAWRDPLTGCQNPLALWGTIADEINRARRHDDPLACVFIDLDGFKHVNDVDGHIAGNAVLAAAGAEFRRGLRSYDTVGRYGGDEFVLVLPGTDYQHACLLAERIAAGIGPATGGLTSVTLTASWGVAQWHPGLGAEELVDEADRRMLAGRDGRAGGRQ